MPGSGWLLGALSILFALASGCSEPVHAAYLPISPAGTGLHEKSTGLVRVQLMRGEEPVAGGISPKFAGNMAQSGDGTLGDRLFRLDPHGLLEGCQYVPSGRVCNFVTLPDGTILGGSLHWILSGHTATPRAGGWVAQGAFLQAPVGVDEQGKPLAQRSPVLVGRAFHCRFAEGGPRCLPVPATDKSLVFAALGAFSLRDGDVRRDVLWVGTLAVDAPVNPNPMAYEIRVLHRCETTEDSDSVTCKVAAMK